MKKAYDHAEVGMIHLGYDVPPQGGQAGRTRPKA